MSFECEECGIGHPHDEGSAHNVFSDVDEPMLAGGSLSRETELEWNPHCHCGFHEVFARLKERDDSLVFNDEATDDQRYFHFKTVIKYMPIKEATRKEIYV